MLAQVARQNINDVLKGLVEKTKSYLTVTELSYDILGKSTLSSLYTLLLFKSHELRSHIRSIYPVFDENSGTGNEIIFIDQIYDGVKKERENFSENKIPESLKYRKEVMDALKILESILRQ